MCRRRQEHELKLEGANYTDDDLHEVFPVRGFGAESCNCYYIPLLFLRNSERFSEPAVGFNGHPKAGKFFRFLIFSGLNRTTKEQWETIYQSSEFPKFRPNGWLSGTWGQLFDVDKGVEVAGWRYDPTITIWMCLGDSAGGVHGILEVYHAPP